MEEGGAVLAHDPLVDFSTQPRVVVGLEAEVGSWQLLLSRRGVDKKADRHILMREASILMLPAKPARTIR